MNIFKKITICMLAILLCLPSILGILASAHSTPLSENDMQLVVEALQEIESQKAAWGLSDVNFTNLRIGDSIKTYNLVNNSWESGRELYPIIDNGRLVLWVISDSGDYLLSNGLTKEVNNVISTETPFALLYDANSAYIYTDSKAVKIYEFTYTVETRSQLGLSTETTFNNIITNSLSNSVSLTYGVSPRAVINTVSCNVRYVPQNYTHTCWAATTACIYNYLNNLSGSAALDDEAVARTIFGNLFNQGIEWDEVTGILNEFDIDYRGTTSPGLIHSSISRGYPVFGFFDVIEGAKHAATIYSSNLINGGMTVMDPQGGSYLVSVAAGGSFRYVNTSTNTTLVLERAFYEPE